MKLGKYLLDNANMEVSIFEDHNLQFYGDALTIYNVISHHWFDAEIIEVVDNGRHIEIKRDRS